MIKLEKARSYIEALDLDYIVRAMCAESYALPRWTREDALTCCKLYKEFLILQKKHLPEQLVPTRQVDEFWHNHILHTQRYTRDCSAIFGHYLHHQPAEPGDNPDNLIDAYLKTKQYYQEEFNKPLEIV